MGGGGEGGNQFEQERRGATAPRRGRSHQKKGTEGVARWIEQSGILGGSDGEVLSLGGRSRTKDTLFNTYEAVFVPIFCCIPKRVGMFSLYILAHF